jgi:dTMP kinase
MNRENGIFISFEGPEASGKSSQINKLKFFLKNQRIPFLLTREPGGTKISEKLRRIILNKSYKISNNEELLLLMASRLNHIKTVIKPALNKGKLVISDRFCDSTFVYQCYVNGFGIDNGIFLHRKLLNNFLPKKTFLFLLDSKEIIRRLKLRKKFNKYDLIDIKFHNRVINGYKKISNNNRRFIIINAEKSLNDIQKQLQKKILNIIK